MKKNNRLVGSSKIHRYRQRVLSRLPISIDAKCKEVMYLHYTLHRFIEMCDNVEPNPIIYMAKG